MPAGSRPETQPPRDRVSCRRCRVYCDWTVDPSACVARSCSNLYAYDGPDGRRWVGCLERVFAADVELAPLVEAVAERRRFGSLRCSRAPLEICPAGVERAYERREPALGCVNPEFAEPPGGDSFRVVAADGAA